MFNTSSNNSSNASVTRILKTSFIGFISGLSTTLYLSMSIVPANASANTSANASVNTSVNTKHCNSNIALLTAEEQQNAQIAWQYFRENTQAKTGLVNAVAAYPSTSLWDMGNSLIALHAAERLNLINTTEFDQKFQSFLTTLNNLQLVDRKLPNKAYNTTNAQMVDYQNRPSPHGIGWSALDIGRLLTALHILQDCRPNYATQIREITTQWQLSKAIEDGQLVGATGTKNRRQLVQEGRLGYEEYAALGFKLWGLNPFKALDRTAFRQFVEIDGIQLPIDRRDYTNSNANNYVVSESYILQGMEFGGDAEFQTTAQKVLDVQQKRFERTNILTAVSEDHIQGKPYFLYNTIYANGTPWANITEDNKAYPKLRALSTKAAFGWHYLYPDHDYSNQLFNTAKTLKAANGSGFYAGQFEETKAPNAILTANTNALILAALLYKAQGSQPLVRSTQISTQASLTTTTQASNKAFGKSTKTQSTKTQSTKTQSTKTQASAPVLLGSYAQGYVGDVSVVNRELHGFSGWADKKLSLAGIFYDLEDDNPGYNIPQQLETLRQNGMTAFLNFSSRRTAKQIANGAVDRNIQQIAEAYASWIKQGDNRIAMLAPLPEMNGDWETYKEDPENFKRAYQRIQQIFIKAGVPRSSVRWVFAPNGWSKNQAHQFENYYPGESAVDVVAFSGYNWGYCQASTWKQWSSPKAVYEPYLNRMRKLAPNKPIVIAQTATTSTTTSGNNLQQKDQWLQDSYRYLANVPGVRGILYFNMNKECDWKIDTTQSNHQGFKSVLQSDRFGYIAPNQFTQFGF
jgi:Protein of unknown function (DUF3131)/Glycosyl hydrolase family 26